MVKDRIIALVLLKGDLVVQSVGFEKYLPVGRLEIVLEYLESWDVDEVIILDIEASQNNRTINFDLIKNASKKIFIPLTVGGGLSSSKNIERAIHSGADKVVINTAIFNEKDFIRRAVFNFGSQCIVAAADVRLVGNDYYVFSNSGQSRMLLLCEWIDKVNDYDVGEVFLNSIDRDGMKCGYDIDLIKFVKNKIKKPIIAAGGAGNPLHVKQLLTQVSSAAAIGNILYHSEHPTSVVKAYLKNNNQNVRSSCSINYEQFEFNKKGWVIPINHDSIYF